MRGSFTGWRRAALAARGYCFANMALQDDWYM
jgi:hypothetical protein